MSEFQVCNTGTTGKTHLRLVQYPRTLCNRQVVIPNKGDETLQVNTVECMTCRRILNIRVTEELRGRR